jgi:hypothetical protein
MTADVRTRVRRQWRRYVVAAWLQVVASLGMSLYLFVRFEQARDVVAELVEKGLFVAYAVFVVDYNAAKPYAWLWSAVKFGAAAWVMMWLTLYRIEPIPPVALELWALGVVCVAAWVLAWRAKATVDLSLDDLIDEDLATKFDARDNPATLEVDDVKVRMTMLRRKARTTVNHHHWASATCSLADIKSMRTIHLRRRRKIPMPEHPHRYLDLTPGSALRFDSPSGEWIFPSNSAHDAYELIKDKREKHALGYPKLGPFLPPGAS